MSLPQPVGRACGLLAVLGLLLADPAAAQPAARLAVRGLEHPVEVVRDRFGINHIYAESEHDLFFAQGYAAAKDRLFQFEV